MVVQAFNSDGVLADRYHIPELLLQHQALSLKLLVLTFPGLYFLAGLRFQSLQLFLDGIDVSVGVSEPL